VSSTWATDLKRPPLELKTEIEQILQKHAQAPFGGLAGEKLVNVLVVNRELRNRHGATE
jgi:K+-transporting ATPase ATPase C chain